MLFSTQGIIFLTTVAAWKGSACLSHRGKKKKISCFFCRPEKCHISEGTLCAHPGQVILAFRNSLKKPFIQFYAVIFSLGTHLHLHFHLGKREWKWQKALDLFIKSSLIGIINRSSHNTCSCQSVLLPYQRSSLINKWKYSLNFMVL